MSGIFGITGLTVGHGLPSEQGQKRFFTCGGRRREGEDGCELLWGPPDKWGPFPIKLGGWTRVGHLSGRPIPKGGGQTFLKPGGEKKGSSGGKIWDQNWAGWAGNTKKRGVQKLCGLKKREETLRGSRGKGGEKNWGGRNHKGEIVTGGGSERKSE